MRLTAIIFLLTLTYSCQNLKVDDKPPALNDNLLIGEWRLDSSSNRFFSYDRLIILEDSSLYFFSSSDGGSLITKGRRFCKDSIATDYYGNVVIDLVDSNHIHLGGGWTRRENYYKRLNDENYRDNLKDYLQQDSLRSKIVGWWKLVASKTPVKLINYYGYYNKFTLHIRNDGNAVFYLENKFDSTADYSYHVNPDGIDFNRGCIVGSDSKISFDSQGRMKLVLDRRMGDTLVLERLTDIK